MMMLMVGMVVLVTYQVFGRYVLHYTPPWSEEMAVYLMIWFGMIGIVAGLRRDAHMSLHYFADKMPQLVQRVLLFIKYGLILIYTSVLTIEGMKMVKLTVAQHSPAMGLTISYHNAIIYAVAAGGVVSIGSLFLAGYVPGVLIALGLMAVSYILALKYGYEKETAKSIKESWRIVKEGFLSLLAAVIIVGGIKYL